MKATGGPRGPERIRPGLDRIRAAFAMTGHPERAYRTVHIAGTNGKGSTACLADAILRRFLGRPVGLYTSPHLLSPEERIRVEGTKIPPGVFARYWSEASALSGKVAVATGEPLSYFEMMTWIACDWFRRREVAAAVMEAGLGGRWDATNLCLPEVSVITNVGRDHAEWLGRSLAGIAAEKAGILRDNTPTILGRLPPAARRVVRDAAREKGSRAWEIGREIRWEDAPEGTVTVHLPGISLPRLRIRMQGEFQRDNALLACAASWVVAASREGPEEGFLHAAREALSDTEWPGRYAPLPGRKNARAWVDGAHNPAAARALAAELSRRRGVFRNPTRIVALWSMLADKDIAGFLKEIAPVVEGIVAYPMETDRAASLSVLSSVLEKRGIRHRLANDFPEGWKIARRWAGRHGMVIVCGSLMAAADAYRFRGGGPA